MDFLTDNEVDFDLPAVKAVSTRFGSAKVAAERALKSEKDVAGAVRQDGRRRGHGR